MADFPPVLMYRDDLSSCMIEQAFDQHKLTPVVPDDEVHICSKVER